MKKSLAFLFVFFFATTTPLRADEGMWLFENFPAQAVQEKYGFQLPEGWLSNVQLASCRFGGRGSASFISPKGLIITNHHVGARDLHQLSTPENNLLENGFYAETLEDERKCPGLEVIVLEKVADITAQLQELLKDTPPEDVAAQRGKLIALFEQSVADQWQLRCEVVTLYQGGAYHLYGYKAYTDIRLVWAPEEAIAAFGGDPDNYEYPRFCLDASMFRAYENDRPAEISHYLRWGTGSVTNGELLFVSGFPGTTNRAFTREHLEFMRDVHFPHRLQKLFRRETVFAAFGNRSLENQRKIANDLGVVQNYRKRAMGQLEGLQTPTLWDGKATEEDKDEKSPEKRISEACDKAREVFLAYDLFEKGDFLKTSGDAFNCRSYQIAKTLVRLAIETEKPDAERMREYRDASLDVLKKSLFVETPIHEDVEILKLTDSLTMLRELGEGFYWDEMLEQLGEHAERIALLSPKQWAIELVTGSRVREVSERRRLAEGGRRALEASNDPMIWLALKMDKVCRELGKEYADEVTNPMTEAYAELARKRFEELGTSVYPDATFTLRLSFGAVKGYMEDDGTAVPPTTNIAGMYARAEALKHKTPFDPPKSWKEGRDKLDPNTTFNFVTTNDIIGGNSGSPVINRKGEIVGLAFDGNIYSLSNNFVYTEKQSRCVSVHTDVILESLRKIYKADRIVAELQPEK